MHRLKEETHSSYEEASMRSTRSAYAERTKETPPTKPVIRFTIYGYMNAAECMMRLLLALLTPFAPFPLVAATLYFGPTTAIGTLAIFALCVWTLHVYTPKDSTVPNRKGSHIFGALSQPRLYFKKEAPLSAYSASSKQLPQPFLHRILRNCPFITSAGALDGHFTKFRRIDDGTWEPISSMRSTPWYPSGDWRTLMPFLTNRPKEVNYVRRWVRTPLAASRPPGEFRADDGAQFEAVALDWSPAPATGPSAETVATGSLPKSKVALLILSGLTGGSKDGYVVDLVNHGNARGWDCFVMIARGLAGTPLLSGECFHGARYADLIASAKVVRRCLPADTRLFVAGVSMGAIIASNALVNGDLCDYVDGVACVSGCMNVSRHVPFHHSRTCWQNLLTQNLKQLFVCSKQMLPRLIAEFGSRDIVQEALNRSVDITDYDAVFVTHLHRFSSVDDYYKAMGSSEEQLLNPESRGIVTVRYTTTQRSTAGEANDGDDHDDGDDGKLATVHATAASTPVMSAVDKSNHASHRKIDMSNSKTQDKSSIDTVARSSSKHPHVKLSNQKALRLVKPLFCLHAQDDPISHVDSMPCIDGDGSAACKIENILCLVTRTGGHVGWPVGLLPWCNGFTFCSSAVIEFFNATALALDDEPAAKPLPVAPPTPPSTPYDNANHHHHHHHNHNQQLSKSEQQQQDAAIFRDKEYAPTTNSRDTAN